jgi:hypothetical protein
MGRIALLFAFLPYSFDINDEFDFNGGVSSGAGYSGGENTGMIEVSHGD